MEDNHQILGYVESDQDLEIFYYFILNPFSIPPTERVRRKFGKFSGCLKVEAKKTYLSNSKFIYIPEKHNLSFIRAQKMLYVFLKRRNIKVIGKANPYFIDIFYKVANEQVFDNERCRVDMTQVFELMQYFLTLDAQCSLKNLVKYHLCFELLGHIEIAAAKELLINLIMPGDNLFRISDKDRKVLTDYLVMVKFGNSLITLLSQFKVSLVLSDKARAIKDDAVKTYIKEMEKRSYRMKPENKPKNLFLSFFHSFFGAKKVKNADMQPEEIYTTVLDVDWLASYTKPIRRSRLSKNSTIGNMSGLLEDIDGDAKDPLPNKSLAEDLVLKPSVSKVEASEKEIEEGSVNPVLRDQNKKVDEVAYVFRRKRNKKALMKIRGLVRFVMCFNLFLNKPQQMFKLKKDKGVLHFTPYPENIQSSNIDIKAVQSNPKDYFEKCLKLESRTLKVLEAISSCIGGALLQKNHGEFMKAIRMNVSQQDWVTPMFFSSEKLFFEVLKIYILKVQFHLENKTLFMTGYWAGKLFIQMCNEL